mgnify:FL=1
MDKALENLKNKNMDAGAIKKMFGEEGYNTASVILQNTEMVKDFTAAVTGTNVAYEQAAINSDTAQAKLEQARNKMKLAAIDLGEKLNPALNPSTTVITVKIAYSRAYTTYSPGARNMKPNSNGSVTPQTNAAIAAEERRPIATFFLFDFAV